MPTASHAAGCPGRTMRPLAVGIESGALAPARATVYERGSAGSW